MGGAAAQMGFGVAVAMLCGGCGDSSNKCEGDACDGEPGASSFGDAAIPVVKAEEACAMQSTRAERGIDRPVDIIFVIDNSGSMTNEIDAVVSNINENFARIVGESGVDYRVIMVSRYGEGGTNVCVEPPLAGASCQRGLHETNSERYFHYNMQVDSWDPWCLILETFGMPDPEGRAPDGWGAWLRDDAEKAFVLITDDSAHCIYSDGSGEGDIEFGAEGADPFEDALLFHQALQSMSPEHFGAPPETRYTFYSIVGVRAADPPSLPWFPHEAVIDERCSSAATPGTSYQALSVITDALRYPVCEGRGFDAIFQVLAANVVESAKADCVFEIPEPPPNQGIDLVTINVEYTPGDGGDVRRFGQVIDSADCDSDSFAIENGVIRLCDDACRVVEADRDAQVQVLYACVISPD